VLQLAQRSRQPFNRRMTTRTWSKVAAPLAAALAATLAIGAAPATAANGGPRVGLRLSKHLTLTNAGFDYTITVTNTGTAPVSGIQVSDVPSGIMDLMRVTDGPAANSGSLPRGPGDALRWHGDLAPGASATVSYLMSPDPTRIAAYQRRLLHQELVILFTPGTPAQKAAAILRTGGFDAANSAQLRVGAAASASCLVRASPVPVLGVQNGTGSAPTTPAAPTARPRRTAPHGAAPASAAHPRSDARPAAHTSAAASPSGVELRQVQAALNRIWPASVYGCAVQVGYPLPVLRAPNTGGGGAAAALSVADGARPAHYADREDSVTSGDSATDLDVGLAGGLTAGLLTSGFVFAFARRRRQAS
jgi:hypothetical protein